MHGGRPITLQGDVAAADVLPYRLKTSLGAAILPGELGWRNRWAGVWWLENNGGGLQREMDQDPSWAEGKERPDWEKVRKKKRG
jgi:hypothetical protein